MIFDNNFIKKNTKTQEDIVNLVKRHTGNQRTENLNLPGLRNSVEFNEEELSRFLTTALKSKSSIVGFEYSYGKVAGSSYTTLKLPKDAQIVSKEELGKLLAAIICNSEDKFVGIQLNVVGAGKTEAILETKDGGVPPEDLAPTFKVVYNSLY